LESTPDTRRREPRISIRSRGQAAGAVNSSVFDNDEFKRIVGLSLGKSSLMMRKDRKGIAI